MGTTLAEKVWADHLVRQGSDGAPDLLYIDLMLMHEVTSPQAFEGLRLAGRKPRHVDQLIATEDHNTPTVDIDRPNPEQDIRPAAEHAGKELQGVRRAAAPAGRRRSGHRPRVRPDSGPRPGPGMTIVCGDSHTSTHGAFGALAFGIGTSEVEHVMATQTLKPQAVQDDGDQRERQAAGGRHRQGHYSGDHREDRHRRRSGLRHRIPRRGDPQPHDGRTQPTVCNLSIEGAAARAGNARAGRGRVRMPRGPSARARRASCGGSAPSPYWKTLKTD